MRKIILFSILFVASVSVFAQTDSIRPRIDANIGANKALKGDTLKNILHSMNRRDSVQQTQMTKAMIPYNAVVRDTATLPTMSTDWMKGNYYRHSSSDVVRYYFPTMGYVDYIDAVSGAPLSSFNTIIDFAGNKYLTTKTVVDSIVFTADTTSGIYGAYTVSRLDFGSTKKKIRFSGGQFDTLQRYSIGNPDSLKGLQMVYFEKTPYGVAVSVPTNATYTSTTTTTSSDSSGVPSPYASAVGSLLAEFDGKMIKFNSDTVRWTDRSIYKRYASSLVAARKPTPFVIGLDTVGFNSGGTNFRAFGLRDSIAYNASSPFSMTMVVYNITGKNYLLGGYQGNSMFYSLDHTQWRLTLVESVGVAPTAFPSSYAVLQVVSDGTNVKYYINGTQQGATKTRDGSGVKYISTLGCASMTTTEAVPDAAILYFSCNQAAYSDTQRTNIYNYIRWKYGIL